MKKLNSKQIIELQTACIKDLIESLNFANYFATGTEALAKRNVLKAETLISAINPSETLNDCYEHFMGEPAP